MSNREPWDFSDEAKQELLDARTMALVKSIELPLLAEIDDLKLENRGLTRQKEEFFAEFERLRRELEEATINNKRLTGEVKTLMAYRAKLSGHLERLRRMAHTLLRELGEDDPFAEIILELKGQRIRRLCYQPNLKRVLEAVWFDHEGSKIIEQIVMSKPQ